MYSIKDGLVDRDIDGLYFIIDIHDKFCFDMQRLYSVNAIGKEIFCIMKRLKSFNLSDVIDEFIPLLIDYKDSMYIRVKRDIQNFIDDMVSVGYLTEE